MRNQEISDGQTHAYWLKRLTNRINDALQSLSKKKKNYKILRLPNKREFAVDFLFLRLRNFEMRDTNRTK